MPDTRYIRNEQMSKRIIKDFLDNKKTFCKDLIEGVNEYDSWITVEKIENEENPLYATIKFEFVVTKFGEPENPLIIDPKNTFKLSRCADYKHCIDVKKSELDTRSYRRKVYKLCHDYFYEFRKESREMYFGQDIPFMR